MSPTKFEKPPVQSTSKGILFVRAADILASATGRAQIESAAEAARALGLRNSDLTPSEPPKPSDEE
jgi:hypothetical protein